MPLKMGPLQKWGTIQTSTLSDSLQDMSLDEFMHRITLFRELVAQ